MAARAPQSAIRASLLYEDNFLYAFLQPNHLGNILFNILSHIAGLFSIHNNLNVDDNLSVIAGVTLNHAKRNFALNLTFNHSVFIRCTYRLIPSMFFSLFCQKARSLETNPGWICYGNDQI